MEIHHSLKCCLVEQLIIYVTNLHVCLICCIFGTFSHWASSSDSTTTHTQTQRRVETRGWFASYAHLSRFINVSRMCCFYENYDLLLIEIVLALIKWCVVLKLCLSRFENNGWMIKLCLQIRALQTGQIIEIVWQWSCFKHSLDTLNDYCDFYSAAQ